METFRYATTGITGFPACYKKAPIFCPPWQCPGGMGMKFIDPCDPAGAIIPSAGEARVLEFCRKSGILVNRREIGYIARFDEKSQTMKSDMSIVANVVEINPESETPLIVRPRVLIPFEVWGHGGVEVEVNRNLTREALYEEQAKRTGLTSLSHNQRLKTLSAYDQQDFIKTALTSQQAKEFQKQYAFKRALKEVLGTYLFQKVGAKVIGVDVQKLPRPNYLPTIFNDNFVVYHTNGYLQLWGDKQPTVTSLAEEIIEKYNLQMRDITYKECDTIFNDFIKNNEELLKQGGKHIDAMIDRGELDNLYEFYGLYVAQNDLNRQLGIKLASGEPVDDLMAKSTEIANLMKKHTSIESLNQMVNDIRERPNVSAGFLKILAAANDIEGGLKNKTRLLNKINNFMSNGLNKVAPEIRQYIEADQAFNSNIKDAYDDLMYRNEEFEAHLSATNTIEDKSIKQELNNLVVDLTQLDIDIDKFRKTTLVQLVFDYLIKNEGFVKNIAQIKRLSGLSGDVIDDFLVRFPVYFRKIGVKAKEQPELSQDFVFPAPLNLPETPKAKKFSPQPEVAVTNQDVDVTKIQPTEEVAPEAVPARFERRRRLKKRTIKLRKH